MTSATANAGTKKDSSLRTHLLDMPGNCGGWGGAFYFSARRGGLGVRAGRGGVARMTESFFIIVVTSSDDSRPVP